eukprot:35589-Eustigmatos_ZCMA.PRE.1
MVCRQCGHRRPSGTSSLRDPPPSGIETGTGMGCSCAECAAVGRPGQAKGCSAAGACHFLEQSQKVDSCPFLVQ